MELCRCPPSHRDLFGECTSMLAAAVRVNCSQWTAKHGSPTTDAAPANSSSPTHVRTETPNLLVLAWAKGAEHCDGCQPLRHAVRNVSLVNHRLPNARILQRVCVGFVERRCARVRSKLNVRCASESVENTSHLTQNFWFETLLARPCDSRKHAHVRKWFCQSSPTPTARSQLETVLRPEESNIPRNITDRYFRLRASKAVLRIRIHSAHRGLQSNQNRHNKTILTGNPLAA